MLLAATPLVGHGQPQPPEPILDAAARLRTRADAAAGLLAVALAGYGARFGWPQPWRDEVLALREHPAGDVRAAAVDLAMATE
jgi:hypothetical protein